VELNRITCPLLLLTADLDHLVPPASTLGIVPHVGSKEVKTMAINAGHIGLAVSSKAHRQFWPEAAGWIAAHSAAIARS
jgi:polyhydroxyalkanoate synthase